MNDEIIQALAYCKISEWKACSRVLLITSDLRDNLIGLISLQHGLSRSEAQDIVQHRVQAVEYRYRAEDFELDNNQEEAEHYWKLAKQSMADYYDMLYLKIERKKKGPV